MTAGCELALFLRAAGPVRAPLRPCCLVALIDSAGRAPVPCAAATEPADPQEDADPRRAAEVLG